MKSQSRPERRPRLIRSPGFKTNDTILLTGSLHPEDQSRLVCVNSCEAYIRNRRLFAVLAVLVVHGLARSGSRALFQVPTDPLWLSAKDILNVLDTLRLHNALLFEGILALATDVTITRLIFQLRQFLGDLGCHPGLLETGPGRRGYRLSTPPENLGYGTQDVFVAVGTKRSFTLPNIDP